MADLCRNHGISGDNVVHAAGEIRRRGDVECLQAKGLDENAKLKTLLAEEMLDVAMLDVVDAGEKVLTLGSRRVVVTWAIEQADYLPRRAVSTPPEISQNRRSKIPHFRRSGAGVCVAIFGGRPRRRGGGADIGGAMVALERTCSGMSSACWRRR